MKHLSSIISSKSRMYRYILLLVLLTGPLLGEESLGDKAFREYTEAEQAKNPDVRKKAFNDALMHYLQAEPSQPSGELCLNIANTYFQLGEYGFAILYYYKAEAQMPRDQEVAFNLHVALQKVGIEAPSPSFIQNYLLYVHTKLSHNEKAVLALILFFAAFGCASGHIWQPQAFLKKMALFFGVVGLIIFTSLLWSDYFSSPQAVIVHPTELRRSAGEQYAVIAGNPGLPGTKVEVLSVGQEGNWMKVRLPSGEIGYIAKEYVRLI